MHLPVCMKSIALRSKMADQSNF